MTPDQEKLLFEVLVELRVLAAQVHLHTSQQRVQATLELTKASKPNMTDDEIADAELEICHAVERFLENERGDLEAKVRAALCAAASKTEGSHLN